MTDKEKLDAIRAEIHRLVDVRGYDREMANDLFTFMDSLPNELVSINEDLDKASKEYEHKRVYEEELERYSIYLDSLDEDEVPKLKEPSYDTQYLLNQGFIDAFKAGANWQKEKDMKWLADNHKQIFNNGWAEGYEVGRDSMEEDMMKDAVDAEITKISPNDHLRVVSDVLPLKDESEWGTKVKIIIIKRE